MPDYLQGEIVWADYPLSDKPEKSKIRPVVIISNADSNELDNDFPIIPVTSKIRNQRFDILLTADKLSAPCQRSVLFVVINSIQSGKQE